MGKRTNLIKLVVFIGGEIVNAINTAQAIGEFSVREIASNKDFQLLTLLILVGIMLWVIVEQWLDKKPNAKIVLGELEVIERPTTTYQDKNTGDHLVAGTATQTTSVYLPQIRDIYSSSGAVNELQRNQLYAVVEFVNNPEGKESIGNAIDVSARLTYFNHDGEQLFDGRELQGRWNSHRERITFLVNYERDYYQTRQVDFKKGDSHKLCVAVKYQQASSCYGFDMDSSYSSSFLLDDRLKISADVFYVCVHLLGDGVPQRFMRWFRVENYGYRKGMKISKLPRKPKFRKTKVQND